jgi:hypothetical protein
MKFFQPEIFRIALVLLLPFVACQRPERPPVHPLRTLYPTALRAMAGREAEVIAEIPAGVLVDDLGDISPFVSTFQEGQRVFQQSPWLRVKTAAGREGWVTAAALQPEKLQKGWFLQKKMRGLLGHDLSDRRDRWMIHAARLPTEADFAWHLREGLALRDTLLDALRNRPQPDEIDTAPDHYWLSKVLPGFVFQRVEGQPYLFIHYAVLLPKALQTSGEQDDLLVQTALLAFPQDSIESFFPSWRFQTDETHSYSNLGAGRHFFMLNTIEMARYAGLMFEPELRAIKDLVIADMTAAGVVYWQSREKIGAELKKIIAQNFSCLTERDKAALHQRLREFAEPTAHGIRVNVRGGL